MSPIIKFNENGGTTLSYITTGGIIEIYFMLKASPKELIKRYQNIIGLPSLPPFWALGWHSASAGYKNEIDYVNNINAYKAANMPLEAIWLDKSYIDKNADFSVNA